MKTPISYYGGKQNLVSEILPLFPDHIQYVEPFTGGGAVFFSKPQSDNEVINDLDNRVINFYRCLKDKEKFDRLQYMIKLTLHSEYEHTKASEILKAPMADEVEFAWAFYVQTNMSFSNKIHGGFAFGSCRRSGRNTKNKRDNFTDKYFKRIEYCEIFNRDAIELIKLKDTPDTFFYCDPPYVSSDQGHYKGFTTDNFTQLLEVLKNIKGKFLISSYPEYILMEYRKNCGWSSNDIKQILSIMGKREETKFKTECLTWNYELKNKQTKLFE